MDRMIYTAMSGARQVMQRQASNSHNLANLNTTGFKADLDSFRALPVTGPGFESRVYTQTDRVGVDHAQGRIVRTDNPLDVAIDGAGYIAVQDQDGNEAYTRSGDLRVTAEGLLETSAGYPVLGNGGPITLTPFEKIQIGADGTVSVQPLGQSGAELAVLDRIRLVKPDIGELERTPDGLFTRTDGELAEPDAAVTLASGSLETSNVNPVQSLVTMIELARQFETQVKLMGLAEKNDDAAGRLLRSAG